MTDEKDESLMKNKKYRVIEDYFTKTRRLDVKLGRIDKTIAVTTDKGCKKKCRTFFVSQFSGNNKLRLYYSHVVTCFFTLFISFVFPVRVSATSFIIYSMLANSGENLRARKCTTK